MTLTVLPTTFAICRLAASAPVPAWAEHAELCSITRTADELSIVTAESNVPRELAREAGWRALKLAGPIPFSQTGVLASILGPLAAAKISIFALSTFDTDYVLVHTADLERAIAALRAAGHSIPSTSS